MAVMVLCVGHTSLWLFESGTQVCDAAFESATRYSVGEPPCASSFDAGGDGEVNWRVVYSYDEARRLHKVTHEQAGGQTTHALDCSWWGRATMVLVDPSAWMSAEIGKQMEVDSQVGRRTTMRREIVADPTVGEGQFSHEIEERHSSKAPGMWVTYTRVVDANQRVVARSLIESFSGGTAHHWRYVYDKGGALLSEERRVEFGDEFELTRVSYDYSCWR